MTHGRFHLSWFRLRVMAGDRTRKQQQSGIYHTLIHTLCFICRSFQPLLIKWYIFFLFLILVSIIILFTVTHCPKVGKHIKPMHLFTVCFILLFWGCLCFISYNILCSFEQQFPMIFFFLNFILLFFILFYFLKQTSNETLCPTSPTVTSYGTTFMALWPTTLTSITVMK